MSEGAALFRRALRDPSDTDARLQLADWLEARGDVWMAAAHRMAVFHDNWPNHYSIGWYAWEAKSYCCGVVSRFNASRKHHRALSDRRGMRGGVHRAFRRLAYCLQHTAEGGDE